ncbi:unnamed protein product [Durusdinium trenchii]|uniref:Uncharacterized protein n=1 Tax=Durusdinium trenchii TaxID=1381693 RepID=A0ABP0RDN9_9DINO
MDRLKVGNLVRFRPCSSPDENLHPVNFTLHVGGDKGPSYVEDSLFYVVPGRWTGEPSVSLVSKSYPNLLVRSCNSTPSRGYLLKLKHPNYYPAALLADSSFTMATGRSGKIQNSVSLRCFDARDMRVNPNDTVVSEESSWIVDLVEHCPAHLEDLPRAVRRHWAHLDVMPCAAPGRVRCEPSGDSERSNEPGNVGAVPREKEEEEEEDRVVELPLKSSWDHIEEHLRVQEGSLIRLRPFNKPTENVRVSDFALGVGGQRTPTHEKDSLFYVVPGKASCGSLSLVSKSYPHLAVRALVNPAQKEPEKDDNVDYVVPVKMTYPNFRKTETQSDASWMIRPGLNGRPGCVSFQGCSLQTQTHFLCLSTVNGSYGDVTIEIIDGTPPFYDAASWLLDVVQPPPSSVQELPVEVQRQMGSVRTGEEASKIGSNEPLNPPSNQDPLPSGPSGDPPVEFPFNGPGLKLQDSRLTAGSLVRLRPADSPDEYLRYDEKTWVANVGGYTNQVPSTEDSIFYVVPGCAQRKPNDSFVLIPKSWTSTALRPMETDQSIRLTKAKGIGLSTTWILRPGMNGKKDSVSFQHLDADSFIWHRKSEVQLAQIDGTPCFYDRASWMVDVVKKPPANLKDLPPEVYENMATLQCCEIL